MLKVVFYGNAASVLPIAELNTEQYTLSMRFQTAAVSDHDFSLISYVNVMVK